MSDIQDYDCGLISDGGGGDVKWWRDYVTAEIGRANQHWGDAYDDLLHRFGLVQSRLEEVGHEHRVCIKTQDLAMDALAAERDLNRRSIAMT